MAHIVILGAGVAGLPTAYDLRAELPAEHAITLVAPGGRFDFTPSNPWVAVGWRTPEQISVELPARLQAKGIGYVNDSAASIDPAARKVVTAGGTELAYDYLVIATGPRLAFEEVPGTGPSAHTHSVCTTAHAAEAWKAYSEFLKKPGPIVIGAVQGASCFGPAYEFAFIVDADLRKRKLRDKVPMTFVTSEPYIGHLGLAGVGDSKGMLESELRQRHIKWITNAKVVAAEAGAVKATEHDAKGAVVQEHEVKSVFTMLLPAFKGVPAVAGVEGLCNPRGFVLIDEHQRNPRYREIFAAGVCVAIPPVEATPVPTGAPKTGYMIESMITAIVENIRADLAGKPAEAKATWNAICLADMGDTGVAFVALPQIPPRNTTWIRGGKWVHVAKVAFEKYFLSKMRSGNTEPLYEKYILKALGIERLKEPAPPR